MVLCKDCFHRVVCEAWTTSYTTMSLDDIPPEIPCGHFKYNADVVPRAEWISLEERLPDKNGVFIVALEDRRYEYFVYFDVRQYVGGKWINIPDKLTVTHWMPLPEPPVMKGE